MYFQKKKIVKCQKQLTFLQLKKMAHVITSTFWLYHTKYSISR